MKANIFLFSFVLGCTARSFLIVVDHLIVEAHPLLPVDPVTVPP